jgi:hypothetical protein
MSFYTVFLIVFSISMLSFSVPTSFSIENLDKSLSYTEKRCDDGSCTVTTCFEDKPCSIDDSNDSPTKTTSSNDKVRQLFGSSDSESESELKNMEFMDVLDDFFDFN